MVIACLFLNRFAQIIICWNHNKTTQLTSSKTRKYLNYILRYTISNLKNKKAARFRKKKKKKYKSYYCLYLRHFLLDFYKRRLILKIRFLLKFRSDPIVWGLLVTDLETFKIDQFEKKTGKKIA